MLIDSHCHLDQFPRPEGIVEECERRSVRVVAVTNLPSHFAIAADRLRQHRLITAALGLHPLFAHHGVRELSAFKRMAPHVDFIGEIGLDFSRHGVSSKLIQERLFDEVLGILGDRTRFITLHSRGAEKPVLQSLRRHTIKQAVFHWFTGPLRALDSVFSDGHFVSINPSMVSSKSGQRVIAESPRDRVLVETDGPFAKLRGRPCSPVDVCAVYECLASRWAMTTEQAIFQVQCNFEAIVQSLHSRSHQGQQPHERHHD